MKHGVLKIMDYLLLISILFNTMAFKGYLHIYLHNPQYHNLRTILGMIGYLFLGILSFATLLWGISKFKIETYES